MTLGQPSGNSSSRSIWSATGLPALLNADRLCALDSAGKPVALHSLRELGLSLGCPKVIAVQYHQIDHFREDSHETSFTPSQLLPPFAYSAYFAVKNSGSFSALQ